MPSTVLASLCNHNIDYDRSHVCTTVCGHYIMYTLMSIRMDINVTVARNLCYEGSLRGSQIDI